MMKGKKFIMFALGIILALTFMNTAGAVEPIKLKYSHIMPAQSPPDKIVKLWSQKILKDSEGTLKIEVFGGGVLGRNPMMYLQQINDGVFDMAMTYPTYFGERFDDVNVFLLPFLCESLYEASLVAQRILDKGLLRGFEGFKVLNLLGTGSYQLNSTFPVKKPEDLKGHKCRSGGKVQAEWITELGMTPIGIPANKAAESLSRGLVKVYPADFLSLKMLRIADAAKHTVKIPLGNFVMLIAMNKEKYENLPPKAKAALDNNIGEAFVKEFWVEGNGAATRKSYEQLKKDPSHTIIVPKDEDLKRWKKAFQPVIEKWTSKSQHREKLFKAVKKELEKIRTSR